MCSSDLPNFIGVFPAVSRQIHRGDVLESQVVHIRNISVQSLNQENIGFEEFVDQFGDIKNFESNVFPSNRLAIEKSLVRFTENVLPTAGLSALLKRDGEFVLHSPTNELRWGYSDASSRGIIVINSPLTKAIIGFSPGTTTEFDGLSVTLTKGFHAFYITKIDQAGEVNPNNSYLIATFGSRVNDALRNSSVSHGTQLMFRSLAKIKLAREASVLSLDTAGIPNEAIKPLKDDLTSFELDPSVAHSPYFIIKSH